MSILDEIIDSLIYDYLKSKNYISAQVLAKEAKIKPLSSSSPKLIDFMKTYFSAYEVVKYFTNEKRPLLDSDNNQDTEAKKARIDDGTIINSNPNLAAITLQITPRAKKPTKKPPDDSHSSSSSSESGSSSSGECTASSTAKTNTKKQAPIPKATQNQTSGKTVDKQSKVQQKLKKTIPIESSPASKNKDAIQTKSLQVPNSIQRVINNSAASRPATNNVNKETDEDTSSSSDFSSSSSSSDESSSEVKKNPIHAPNKVDKTPSSVQKNGKAPSQKAAVSADSHKNGPALASVSSPSDSSCSNSSSSSSSSSESNSSSSESDSSSDEEAAKTAPKKTNANQVVSANTSKNLDAKSSKANLTSTPHISSINPTKILEALKAKEKTDIEITKDLIREKLAPRPDIDVMTAKLKVSLLCPLSKKRMEIPCRATTCSHIQCFDAAYYLQMNEKKATWTCPICNKKALPDDLAIDGLFFEIVNTVPDAYTEVQFDENATFDILMPKKVAPMVMPEKVAPMVVGKKSGRK